MSTLEQKIKEFCQAIQETKEFVTYKKAAEIYASDREAQILMNDFQMAQQEVEILKQGNFSGQEELEEKFEDLLEKVRGNKPINELVGARKQMEVLTGDLAITISNNLDFPFTLPPKKGCGCGG